MSFEFKNMDELLKFFFPDVGFTEAQKQEIETLLLEGERQRIETLAKEPAITPAL